MKPSSFRIRASWTLTREAGMSTRACSARFALRIRVNMSAMGSVMLMRAPRRRSTRPPRPGRGGVGARRGDLPGGLDDARDLPPEGQHPEADAAHLEAPEVAPRAPADPAAMVLPDLELRLPLRFQDQGLLRHAAPVRPAI